MFISCQCMQIWSWQRRQLQDKLQMGKNVSATIVETFFPICNLSCNSSWNMFRNVVARQIARKIAQCIIVIDGEL